MPQVLLEAFAARLPVVATAVGGVPEMAGGRGLLIGPSDAPAGAAALQRLLDEPAERARHVEAGVAFVREHTLQAESARLAEFLDAAQ
jgi:glycosyltransferase involved in cell wall biosynthesis